MKRSVVKAVRNAPLWIGLWTTVLCLAFSFLFHVLEVEFEDAAYLPSMVGVLAGVVAWLVISWILPPEEDSNEGMEQFMETQKRLRETQIKQK